MDESGSDNNFIKKIGALAGIGAVSSFPSLAHATGKPVVEGVSHPINLPPGCRFSPRYPRVTTVWQQAFLQLQPDENKPHQTACVRSEDLN